MKSNNKKIKKQKAKKQKVKKQERVNYIQSSNRQRTGGVYDQGSASGLGAAKLLASNEVALLAGIRFV